MRHGSLTEGYMISQLSHENDKFNKKPILIKDGDNSISDCTLSSFINLVSHADAPTNRPS